MPTHNLHHINRLSAQLQACSLFKTRVNANQRIPIQGPVMTAAPNPHTARWFAGLFHECSRSLQQWESLAESRRAECHQLRCAIETLQGQKRDGAAEKAFYEQLIAEQASSIRSLASDRALEPRPREEPVHVPPRPRTPWPSGAASSSSECESDTSSEETQPAKRMKMVL